MRPSFEIRFSVVADPRARRALWVRGTTLTRGDGRTICVAWGALFDAHHPDRHASGVAPAAPRCDPGRWVGAVPTARGELRWDLRYEPRFDAHGYVPGWLERLGIAQTHSRVTAPFARVCGTYQSGQESFELEDGCGLQNHIWGTRRVDRLLWVFVPAFDDAPEVGLEAVWVKPSRFVPALTFAIVRRGATLSHRTSVPAMLRGRASIDFPRMKIDARGLALDAALDPRQVARYVYRDPDGAPRFIEHSDTGSATCTIDGERHVCRDLAAVEFHGTRAWSGGDYLDPYR